MLGHPFRVLVVPGYDLQLVRSLLVCKLQLVHLVLYGFPSLVQEEKNSTHYAEQYDRADHSYNDDIRLRELGFRSG